MAKKAQSTILAEAAIAEVQAKGFKPKKAKKPKPVAVEVVEEPQETLFDDIAVQQAVAVIPNDGIPASDADLSDDEKKLFKDLLNRMDPLEKRAARLVHLSKLKSTKTAAVGLRAIQEINSITGISKDIATESASLFSLPEGSKMAVLVDVVDK